MTEQYKTFDQNQKAQNKGCFQIYLDVFKNYLSLLIQSQERICDYRGKFRTQSNMYDRTFLVKIVQGFQLSTFSQKNFIIDIRLGSRDASALSCKLRKICETDLCFLTIEPILKPLQSQTQKVYQAICFKFKKCSNAMNISRK